jgi:hypothetical protein
MGTTMRRMSVRLRPQSLLKTVTTFVVSLTKTLSEGGMPILMEMGFLM